MQHTYDFYIHNFEFLQNMLQKTTFLKGQSQIWIY